MKRRLFTTLTAFLLALSSWASDIEIDGIHYELNSSAKTASVTSTLSIYSNNTYSGDITIPASVNYRGRTYSVTSIGNDAFFGCTGLTSITIPSSVTRIGQSAFYGCDGLTSVTIPSSVTSIGQSAFSGCKGLTSITIPSSVRSIGVGAFQDCTGLTSITIPSSVTSIGEDAFYGCTGLTSITIPSSVKSIYSSAFEGCTGLTSITIPSSVTSIGEDAFYGCTGLTSITACKMDPSEYNCNTDAFDDVSYSSVTLYVPAGSARAYKALYPWSDFSNIVETDLTSIQTPR